MGDSTIQRDASTSTTPSKSAVQLDGALTCLKDNLDHYSNDPAISNQQDDTSIII